MGNESVGQLFLGILICTFWLCLILLYRPYRAVYDNVVAAVLALQLLITLVTGVSLKLYQATPKNDKYERQGFGLLLVLSTSICVIFSILAIMFGTPCIQKRLDRFQEKRTGKRTSGSAPEDHENVIGEEYVLELLTNPLHNEKATDQAKKPAGVVTKSD